MRNDFCTEIFSTAAVDRRGSLPYVTSSLEPSSPVKGCWICRWHGPAPAFPDSLTLSCHMFASTCRDLRSQRRASAGGRQVLSLAAAGSDSKPTLVQALEKYNIEKDIAAYIKKEFDKKYTPTWHCIVGRNFGSYVTHETKHFIYFYLGEFSILQSIGFLILFNDH